MDQIAATQRAAQPQSTAFSSAIPSSGQAPAASGAAFGSSVPSAPSLSLPKGGGAIHGIGEKFNVNLSTGTGSATIPIRVSPGRDGFQPQLSLSYSSGAGNGPFGMGWQLSHAEISRKTSKGLPRYSDPRAGAGTDVFLLSDAEDLVPRSKRDANGNVVFGADGPLPDEHVQDGYLVRRYSPRIEGSFLRIEQWTSLVDSNDIFWRTTSQANVTSIFGKDDESRVYDPNVKAGKHKNRIFSWLISESYDSKGNATLYNYKAEDSENIPSGQANEANRSTISRSANRYIKSIRYGNTIPNRDSKWTPTPASLLHPNTWLFSIIFDYGEHDIDDPKPGDSGVWACRQDPFSDFHSGFEIRTYRLCRRILMFHHFAQLGLTDRLVSSTDLAYSQSSTTTYLQSAVLAGYATGGDGTAYTKRAMPPVEFEYSLFPSDEALSDLTIRDVDPKSLENLPIGLDGETYRLVDLDGEGLPGFLTRQGEGWFYKRNSSANNFLDGETVSTRPRFQGLESLSSHPNVVTGSTSFGDVTGEMKLDVIQMDTRSWGYYQRTDNGGWGPFRPFRNFPSVDPKDPNVKFVDLTGDGLADILIYADTVYSWYPSLGKDGFGNYNAVTQPLDERQGPASVFSDTEQTIYLADMSGDGLADLVRIRNGDISYWPSLGYGQYGPLIRMDNAPWFDFADLFNQNHIHLADLDGSGTTDVLYLGSSGVDLYLNQSGNSFSDRKRLDLFPPTDNLCVVSTVDILGNGTPCIVWSSLGPSANPASMRYLDIMQGKKPHLLTKITNNLGMETTIQYAPSTKFYLEDKSNGAPWITRLPFPVLCVEKLEVVDHISNNRFVSTYRYHHGFYDGFEREFRGFAMVEKRDTDDFASMSKIGPANNVDPSWHAPPVRTKTWFHTGTFLGDGFISRQMASEYFGAPKGGGSGGMKEFYGTLLDDTVLPTSLDVGQQREACRALKGHALRTETYADDGCPKAHIPYTVEESNYTIVPIQPHQDLHLHGVYFVHPRETISLQFEREVDDPRITHQLVLEENSFGAVTKSLKIAYGRQPGKSSLSGIDREKQETTLITYSEADFTNSIETADYYRAPQLCEVRQYELSGLEELPAGSIIYSITNFAAHSFSTISSLPEIPIEQEGGVQARSKRLVKKSRVFYRKDDLTGLLPLGQLEPMGLPGVTYGLAFTPGLLSLYQRRGVSGSTENLIPDPSVTLGVGGYVDLDCDGHWWEKSGRISYHPGPSPSPAQELAEARDHFFRPRCFIDPFENMTLVDYDSYSMFPVVTKDAMGNTERSVLDYRVLQPSLVVDKNGNRNAAAYDALGMVVGTAIMGKEGENMGDSLDVFRPDLTRGEIDEFFSDPSPIRAATLLGTASSRIIYDVDRYWIRKENKEGTPTFSAVITRNTHNSDSPPPSGAYTHVVFSYSDGLLRVIQQKIQAAPDSADRQKHPRWLGSGWTVFNNKGKPVRQFEPFFDRTYKFTFDQRVGISSVLFYDPLERLIGTLKPNHTWQKTVFSPWVERSYDSNDLVLADPRNDKDLGDYFRRLRGDGYLPTWYESRIDGHRGPAEQAAARKTSCHADTPSVTHFDPLGRAFLAISDNGEYGKYDSRVEFDIQGQQRSLKDAKGRLIARYDYDLQGNIIHQASMEQGEKWILNSVTGKPIFVWDSRGSRFRSSYDSLQRNTYTYLQHADTPGERLVSRTFYGEEESNGESRNQRGRVTRALDQAGITTFDCYDFKGNILSNSRQIAQDYKGVIDWSGAVSLEETIYQTKLRYDALNRVITQTTPDGSLIRRKYNKAGQLEQIDASPHRGHNVACQESPWVPIVTDIEYNARSQRTKIKYGNGTCTLYTYNDLTFELTHLRTSRGSVDLVQDIRYTYDPVGNISQIQDDAQKTIFFRNCRVDPKSDYSYDPLYRLISASGREHLGQGDGRLDYPGASDTVGFRFDQPNVAQAMGMYLEKYLYDAVGNILSVDHRPESQSTRAGWKRRYAYDEESQLEEGKSSNRLSCTSIGKLTERYRYDGNAGLHGNMTSMPHMSHMQWDFRDQLHATSKQVMTNGGTPETTYYTYDGAGMRIRKVTESQADSCTLTKRLKERIYLGDFEIYRKYNLNPKDGSDISLERTTLHIVDDQKRVALIETRTKGHDRSPGQLTRYQISNLLGSTTAELDNEAHVISYEEYFPFGGTSYSAVSSQTETPKRYRYTGKERDEESGLYYHGARYYACWLGRWINCDPSGLQGGPNLFAYVSNNPINKFDPNGKWEYSLGYVVLGAVLAVATIAVVAAVATVAAPVLGGALLAAGLSEATVAGLGTLAAVGGALKGVRDAAKTMTELRSGINEDTGKEMTKAEKSMKLGALPVTMLASAIGLSGAFKGGGGLPPGAAALEDIGASWGAKTYDFLSLGGRATTNGLVLGGLVNIPAATVPGVISAGVSTVGPMISMMSSNGGGSSGGGGGGGGGGRKKADPYADLEEQYDKYGKKPGPNPTLLEQTERLEAMAKANVFENPEQAASEFLQEPTKIIDPQSAESGDITNKNVVDAIRRAELDPRDFKAYYYRVETASGRRVWITVFKNALGKAFGPHWGSRNEEPEHQWWLQGLDKPGG